jgi:MFS family permease
MFALFVLVPTLLETPASSGFGFGATATQAGLILLPAVITMVVFSALAGILIRRFGTKPPMLVGGVALTAAFAISALAHGQIWLIALNVALAGVGIGFALASIANAIVDAVPATQTGEALSTNTIARTIGSSIGTAVATAALSAHSTSQAGPNNSSLTSAFWISAAAAALSIVVALFVPSPMRKATTPDREQRLVSRSAGLDLSGATGGADTKLSVHGESANHGPGTRSA